MEKTIQDLEKKTAAEKAATYVEDGMVIGLGTGSTISFAIRKLGALAKEGLRFKAVSTSDSTTKLALSLGIELMSIDEAVEIDLTIDGADEVDNNLNGIKGGGGALLFEKIAALSSKKNIWAVDSSKLVETLGKFPLPVEIIPFGYKRTFNKLAEMKLNPELRMNGGEKYFTDSGNYVLDLKMNNRFDTGKLDNDIKLITGVVETGLFIGVADIVIVAKNNEVEILKRKN